MQRRQFLKLSAAGTAAMYLSTRAGFLQRVYGQIGQQPQLPGSAIPQFVDPLPGLHTIIAGGGEIELQMTEFLSPVMPSTFVPAAGTYSRTYVWGYRDAAGQDATSYIGPVIVAERGTPTQVKWVNNLGDTSGSNLTAWLTSTDQTLHWADPLSTGPSNNNYSGPIPAVPHLHGGEVPPMIDGGPDSWFTSDGNHQGHAYYAGPGGGGNVSVYRYPNSQEAASIWFHDHVLGATRLNVYAGLAGAYLLVDPNLNLPFNLPGPGDIVPLVIQDRSFDVNGQFFMPNVGLNPEHPFWVPEFVGDTIVVNGKVWPRLAVERKRYRFLFLNGSNARAYEFFLVDPVTKVMGPPMWVIGTDGGYLDTPVKLDPNVKPNDKLISMPGERYDVIIDFNDPAWLAANPNFSGTLLMRNSGRTPYPKGASPQGSTVGRIMQFNVGAPPAGGDSSYDPASGQPLRSGGQTIVRLPGAPGGPAITPQNVQKIRQLTLNEVLGPGGPLEILVNNTKWSGLSVDKTTFPDGVRPDFAPVTVGGVTEYFSELPNEGDTEVWEIVNLTADAHPIHLHLVQFQLINRQNFNTNKYNGAYNAAFPGGVYVGGYGPPLDYNTGNPRALGGNPDITPHLQGNPQPPLPQEAGWKDTVIMFPGQVTRIVVRFAPTELGLELDPAQYVYPFDPNAGEHGYVWHCHIIDHEDNEMMRPDQVQPKAGAQRTYVQGPNY